MVDHDYSVAWAQRYHTDNPSAATNYHIVTALESNSNSMFLYPSTKGLIERDVVKIGFSNVNIFRPAFLIGRPGGRLMETVFKPLIHGIEWFKPNSVGVDVSIVAAAMV